MNLAGAGLGDHRWTSSYKKLLLNSRIETTTTLAEGSQSFLVLVGWYHTIGYVANGLLVEDESWAASYADEGGF